MSYKISTVFRKAYQATTGRSEQPAVAMVGVMRDEHSSQPDEAVVTFGLTHGKQGTVFVMGRLEALELSSKLVDAVRDIDPDLVNRIMTQAWN